MSRISAKRFKSSADEIVEEENRHGSWPVFDRYEPRGRPGERYVYAPREHGGARNGRYNSAPLSRGSVGLFLEFSNWPVQQGMTGAVEPEPGAGLTLDTDPNADAALAWAETYGVLGLGRLASGEHSIGGSSGLHRAAAMYTGKVDWVHGPDRAYRMSARGGVHETVEAFAFEAWQAYLARRLYELASREILDEAAIVRLMGDDPPRVPKNLARRMGISETEEIRSWALGAVEEAVMLKVENTCYPTVQGSPGSYRQGWGFKSLLGAMWLQMMWLMVAQDNRCRWCGALFEQTRRDKRFCDADCRAKWNYHRGTGKSSRRTRKQARDGR